MSAARRFSLLGAALAVGAPLGLVVVRWAAARRGRLRTQRRWDALTYGYVYATTTTAFSLFGLALGRGRDQLIAQQAKTEAQREAFAAVVAHDLRGPVQALRLQIDLLLEHATDGEVRVSTVELERIRRVSSNLGRLVEDLMDAGRIEAGRLALDRRPVEIDRATIDLVERMRPALAPHPVSVDVAAPPPIVELDLQRFDQVLTNLLENAAKYSEDATPIRVVVGPARGGAVVSVEDLGMGMSPVELPRLFDRYYQAQRARAKKSGLGLGLHIAKGLMDAHGGRIEVDSAPGKGTTFYLWFPAP